MMNIMNPPADWSTMKKLIWLRGTPINGGEELTVSGTPPLSLPNSLGNPLKAWEVGLEPYQNLNGYDNPWPAGGGKNLLQILPTESTVSNGVTFTVNADGTISTQGTASGTAVFRHYITASDLPAGEDLALNGVPSGGGWMTIYGMAFCNAQGAVIGEADSGSGTTISASRLSELAQVQIVVRNGINANGKLFTPMIRLASITDSSFAPYANLCPISGTDKVTVWTSGKNLFDSATCLGGNGFLEQQDGSWYIVNNSSIATDTAIWQTPIVYSGRMSIRLSYKNINATASQGGRFKWKYSDGTTAIIYLPVTMDYVEFSNTSSVNKNVVALTWDYGSSSNSTWFKDIQLEFGSTASDYAPYVAPSQTVLTLPSTVYTGTIGSEGGESRWGEVDLGTLNWTYFGIEGHQRFGAVIDAKPNTINLLCSCYNAVAYSDVFNNTAIGIAIHTDGTQVAIYDPDYTDATSFKAAMSGVQLVYELATPTTFAVPSVTIPTPSGTATTWATAEDGVVDSMEVTYVGKA